MQIKFNLNIKKKHFYILLSVLVLVLGAIFVNAFGTNDPATFGHSVGELATPTCLASEKLTDSGSGMVCSADLTADADSSTSNELQTISVANQVTTLSNGGGTSTFDCTCFTTSASGAGPVNRQTCTAGGYRMTGGGCRDTVAGRYITRSEPFVPPTVNCWECQSDDGAANVVGSLVSWACGCRMT